MSNSTDSKWDSIPVYLIFALANVFFLVAWIFNLTDFGHNARAAGSGWHIVACVLTVCFWVYTYLLSTDKIDSSKGISIAIWAVLFVLVPLCLCGFTFTFAS